MNSRRPVQTVSKDIQGHMVLIEVYRTTNGYAGKWCCLNCSLSGSKAGSHRTIDGAIAAEEWSAAFALDRPCRPP